MYTDDKNAQIVLALLKKYNIKKIVISPGATNIPIAGGVQIDPFFEVYSVIDERSAAYFATGLSHESGEPVAISCTGATASRNYLPALTEAYYRNLPIIALTCQQSTNDYDSLKPQMINRTFSPIDAKRFSVHLPVVKDEEDEESCILSVNKALIWATKKGCGPVHINIFESSRTFTTVNLPVIPQIYYFQTHDLNCCDNISLLKEQLIGKKIGLLIGAHRKFSEKENAAIERFIDTYDVVVFCDNTSNYHGKNKILLSMASGIRKIHEKPDLVIDIGSVTAVYSAPALLKGAEFWRISEDGEFHQRCGNLRNMFDCPEFVFFNALADEQIKISTNGYYSDIIEKIGELIIPDLSFSNIFVSIQMAKKLPEHCSLHIGASESLANMNFLELKETIDSSANVGTLGIDGSISTLVGQSMVNKNKLYFGQVGDLTFFYDMNALGIRHISKNIRLMIVNNGCGVRFRVDPYVVNSFGDKAHDFIAAGGHNGSAEGWAKSMGFEYFTARTKGEFLTLIDDFCSPEIEKFNKPVLFEVFTTVKEEQDGWNLIRDMNRPKQTPTKSDSLKGVIKRVLPEKAVNIFRNMKE